MRKSPSDSATEGFARRNGERGMELPVGRAGRLIGDGRLSRSDGCELEDDEVVTGFGRC